MGHNGKTKQSKIFTLWEFQKEKRKRKGQKEYLKQ